MANYLRYVGIVMLAAGLFLVYDGFQAVSGTAPGSTTTIANGSTTAVYVGTTQGSATTTVGTTTISSGSVTTVIHDTTVTSGSSTTTIAGSSTVGIATTTYSLQTYPVTVSAQLSSLPAGQSFTFFAKSNAPSPTYSWSFGDGTGGNGQTVTHAYATAGSYTVTATLTGQNAIGVGTTQVQVLSPPNGPQLTVTVLTSGPAGNGEVPVSGATVTVSQPANFPYSSETIIGTQGTNPSGQAVFATPGGAYTVTVTATGFQTSTQQVSVGSNGLATTIFLTVNCPRMQACPQSLFGSSSVGIGSEIFFGVALTLGGIFVSIRGGRSRPGL